jgi:lipid-A-disaccharide synthase
MLVPEFIQEAATVENLSLAIEQAFDHDERDALVKQFAQLETQLSLDSGSVAAAAIAELVCQ